MNRKLSLSAAVQATLASKLSVGVTQRSQESARRIVLITTEPNYDRIPDEQRRQADELYKEIREMFDPARYFVRVVGRPEVPDVNSANIWIAHGLPPNYMKGLPDRIQTLILRTKTNNKKYGKKEAIQYPFLDKLHYQLSVWDKEKIKSMW
jgi:hypothetical protein